MSYNPFATERERNLALTYIILSRDHDDAKAVLKFIIEHYEHAHRSAQTGPSS